MLANCTRSAKTGYFAMMVNDLLESAEKKLEEKIKMSKKKEMYWFWAYPLAVFRVSCFGSNRIRRLAAGWKIGHRELA